MIQNLCPNGLLTAFLQNCQSIRAIFCHNLSSFGRVETEEIQIVESEEIHIIETEEIQIVKIEEIQIVEAEEIQIVETDIQIDE